MELSLHQYLHYSQHEQPTEPGLYCSLVWDLRETPAGAARHVKKLDKPLSTRRLNEPATFPPVTSLQITCDIFPEPWVIKATNTAGVRGATVTLLDVLNAIYTALHVPLGTQAWNDLPTKKQQRVQAAFERRCRLALNPDSCFAQGMLRIDCLVNHTVFGGLSVSLEKPRTCILSLRRPSP